MGKIRCLNCRNEITTISGMECPHCRAQLSHVKIAFLSYLGPEDSLAGYQRSLRLVLFKTIFELLRSDQELSVSRVSEVFRQYYVKRKQAGLPIDKEPDARIVDLEKSDLHDIWLLINMNPFAAISKHGFLKINGNGLNGVITLQKGIDTLTTRELDSVIDIVEKKLIRYYESIGSVALSGTIIESIEALEVPIIEGAERMLSEQVEAPSEIVIEPIFTEVDSIATTNLPAEVKVDTYANAPGSLYLEDLPLSQRAFNALKRSGMSNLEQLRASYYDKSIAEIKNIGKTVIQEIGTLLEMPVETKDVQGRNNCDPQEISVDGIFAGELGEETKLLRIADVFSENVFNIFRQYCDRNGLVTVGDLIGLPYINLIAERGFGKGKMIKIIEKWTAIVNGEGIWVLYNEDLIPEVEPIIEIHASNLPFGIGIVANFPGERKIHELLRAVGIKTLRDLNGYTRTTLARKIQYEKLNPFMKALEHLKKPYSEVLEEYLEGIAKDKNFGVFVGRTSGKTLQAVGEEFGISRERVRQICVTMQRHLMPIVRPMVESLMQTNGAGYYREEQIRELVDNEVFANAIVYTLLEAKNYIHFGSPSIFFDTSSYPAIDSDLRVLVADIVGDGINFFESVEKIEQDLDVAGFGFLTADDFLGLLIEFGFAFYGDYVLKDRKSYGKLCARIVEEEFPDGISNSKEDMDLLRKLVKQQYGELDLPENDRSVFARICDYLILRGRSKYIAPAKVFVDEDVLSEIKRFIDDSKQKDIFYSELFAEFEGFLMMMTNIDNHQFLHGVLRYYYPADYSYSRDFLSKETGEAGQSLADRLTNYVSSTGTALHKNDILRHFPGIAEAVLFNVAYNFKGLLQWDYNYYNSLENLHLTDEDVQAIEKMLCSLLDANDGYCSEGMLFEKALADLMPILEKATIKKPMNMFYVAQELFSDKLAFRNPHIARIGRFKSLVGIEIATDLVGDKDELSLHEFNRMAERLKWSSVSSGIIFTEIEKGYVRTAIDTYIRRDKFSVSEEDVAFLAEMFVSQSDGNWYLPLQLFADSEEVLPGGLPINEFLIGSLVQIKNFGWHIVAPQIKDRRYQRGILVRNERDIITYDHLVWAVLKENDIAELPENDLLSFLMIRSLALRYIPKELQTSSMLHYSDGVYTVL